MLQILSTSNETSTGAELVQNGNFSQLGADLVENGLFDELGTDVITNGSFATDTDWTKGNGWSIAGKAISTQALGSEEVTNGDFSDTTAGNIITNPNFTDLPLGVDWNDLGSPLDVASFDENGLTITSVNGNGIGNRVNQSNVTEAATSYKVTYTIHSVSLTGNNTVRYFNGNSYIELPTAIIGTPQTLYYTTASTIANAAWFFRIATNDGSTTDFVTISSISVEELGEGWTLQDGWSIGEDEAIFSGTDFYTIAPTVPIIEIGKTYKLNFDATVTNGGFKVLNGTQFVPILFSTVGGSFEHFFTGGNTIISWARYSVGSQNDFTITNISVKEIATSYLTQDVSLSAKTWKIIYSVSDYIAGSVSATDYGAVTTANAVGITEYVEIGAISDFRMVNIDGYFEGAVTGISAELVDPNGYWTLGTGWTFGDDKAISDGSGYSNIFQNIASLSGKSLKVTFEIKDWLSGTIRIPPTNRVDGLDERYSGNDVYVIYFTTTVNYLSFQSVLFDGSITNISVEQVDPNDYWTLGTGWSIGTDKAISTVTDSNSDITQSILTAGKTYRTVYEIVDYDAGTAQAVVTGSEGADAVAIETYTEDLTTTGTDFSIRSKLGTFDGAVSSVSVKQLGTYEDQSIYVTAADVQTIAQADVYYLVELTSMGSKNSLYFLPSSVVPNNGRYTKLNFTVISKDAIQQPTLGIISFYDSVGGFDTYPMGFYEFRIYEQTSSTNLDPLLATGLLEKGFAFVRDFSGNMQELTDGFKEYNPTLTQYVYSK